MGKASITINVGAIWNGGTQLDKAVSSLKRMEKMASQSSESVSRDLALQGDKWEQLGTRVYNAGKTIADVGDSLTKNITQPMSVVGGYCVDQAVTFDTSLANLNKTADLTADELGTLRDAALKASKTQPVTAEQIVNAEALGAQLGVTNDNLQDFSDTVNGLDIATNMNFEQAGTEMAQFANITKMSQSEFENYGSTIVDLGNHLATTESNISSMSLRLAGVSSSAKFSQADILGMAGAMSSLGIKSEAGGSAMTRIVASISKAVSNGSDAVQEYARVSGMSADEFADKWRTKPIEAMEALVSGLANCEKSGEDMNVVLEELGIKNTRDADAMRRLAGSGDLLKESVDRANKAWGDNTALTNEVDKRNESLESRFQTLQNKVNASAIEVGSVLADALLDAADAASPLIDGVGDMATAFAHLDTPTKTAITTLAGVAVAAGPVLSVTGRLVQGIGNVGIKFGEMQQSAAVFSDALQTVDGSQMRVYASSTSLASKMGTAGNAAAKAAGGADKYVKAWEGMTAAAKQVGDANDRIHANTEKMKTATEKASTALAAQNKKLDEQRDKAQKAYEANATLVSSWSKSTKEAEKAAEGIDGLSTSVGSIKAEFANCGTAAEKANSGLTVFKNGVKGVSSVIGGAIKDFAAASAATLAIAAITSAVGLCIEKYTEWKAEQDLVNAAMMDASSIAGASSDAVGALGDAYAAMEPDVNGVYEKMRDTNKKIAESFNTVGSNTYLLENYVSTIEELAGKSQLTAGEQEKLKIAVQGYNEITGASVGITDAATGSLDTSTAAIKANADAWEYNAKKQAYADAAAESYKRQAEAELEASKAQAKYNDALKKQSEIAPEANRLTELSVTGKHVLTQEEQKLVSEYSKVTQEVNKNKEAMDKANKAVEKAGENAKWYSDQMGTMSDAVAEVKGALDGFGDGVAGTLDGLGVSVDSLSTAFASAGVSAETLNSIGASSFAALAQACNGDIDQMVAAIGIYNQTGILTKDGQIIIDDTELVDANGQAVIWNGSDLVYKDTNVHVDHAELTDAQGNVYEWNGSQLVPKTTSATSTGDVSDGKATKQSKDYQDTEKQRKDKNTKASASGNVISGEATKKSKEFKSSVDAIPDSHTTKISATSDTTAINSFTSALASIPRSVTTTVTQYIHERKDAAGGIRIPHADGGIVNHRYHAHGSIVNKPGTGIPLDIVGEAGAEAIVPLTNKRYATPFARNIAEQMGKVGAQPSGPVYNVYIDGAQISNGGERAKELIAALVDEFVMS